MELKLSIEIESITIKVPNRVAKYEKVGHSIMFHKTKEDPSFSKVIDHLVRRAHIHSTFAHICITLCLEVGKQ